MKQSLHYWYQWDKGTAKCEKVCIIEISETKGQQVRQSLHYDVCPITTYRLLNRVDRSQGINTSMLVSRKLVPRSVKKLVHSCQTGGTVHHTLANTKQHEHCCRWNRRRNTHLGVGPTLIVNAALKNMYEAHHSSPGPAWSGDRWDCGASQRPADTARCAAFYTWNRILPGVKKRKMVHNFSE